MRGSFIPIEGRPYASGRVVKQWAARCALPTCENRLTVGYKSHRREQLVRAGWQSFGRSSGIVWYCPEHVAESSR
jgi:hypothetical protein